jgi:hypothetical protein
MKKYSFLTMLLTLGFVLPVMAQDKDHLTIGIGPDFILPVGNAAKTFRHGIGGSVQGSYGVTDNIAAFAQASTSFYDYKKTEDKATTMCMASFIAGARYHIYGFTAGLGVGYSNFNDNGNFPGGFTYSPQIGYAIGNVDFILHYTGAAVSGNVTKGSFSSFGLKVYYNFPCCKK